MKQIQYPKPKPRSKAAKIRFLKRSAAGKSAYHKRIGRKFAFLHFAVAAVALVAAIGLGSNFILQAAELIPPSGNDPQIDGYIRVAQAASQAQRDAAARPDQIGRASWYALGLRSPDALTCASTKFPRGTHLKVKDLRNGKVVVCLVNDYGPQPHTNRVIDLSRGSYSALEGLGSGTMPVEIRRVEGP